MRKKAKGRGNAAGGVAPIAEGAAVPGAHWSSVAEASSGAGRRRVPRRAAAWPASGTAGAAPAKAPATGRFKSGGRGSTTAGAGGTRRSGQVSVENYPRRLTGIAGSKSASRWAAGNNTCSGGRGSGGSGSGGSDGGRVQVCRLDVSLECTVAAAWFKVVRRTRR